MSQFIKISEAASIAFHTAALLAQRPGELVSSREIARTLGASENHVSKVLQRLVHGGYVTSTRGPSGGFRIKAGWQRIKLLDLYETVEGPIQPGRCLLDLPVCRGNRCALGAILHKTNEAVRKCLGGTTLAEMSKSFHPGGPAPAGRRPE